MMLSKSAIIDTSFIFGGIMKKLTLVLLSLTLFACNEDPESNSAPQHEKTSPTEIVASGAAINEPVASQASEVLVQDTQEIKDASIWDTENIIQHLDSISVKNGWEQIRNNGGEVERLKNKLHHNLGDVILYTHKNEVYVAAITLKGDDHFQAHYPAGAAKYFISYFTNDNKNAANAFKNYIDKWGKSGKAPKKEVKVFDDTKITLYALDGDNKFNDPNSLRIEVQNTKFKE